VKIRVEIEVPDYSLEEMSNAAGQFLQLDRTPDGVDMLMAVLDGALEITYRVLSEETS
jgi:hypothetical protein